MFQRLLKLPGRLSTFVLGPRQTGKTTFIKAQLPPDAWTIDLLLHDVALKYAKNPELFLAEAERRAEGGCTTIFIDEIQKVPALLDSVHALIERGKLRFILSGSSARKLRRGGGNLLGGRAAMRRMHPLTAEETGDAFDLERTLRFGALPAVATSSDEEARERLVSYVETYLREEVMAEALVRDLGGFGRFLDVAAAQSGDLLNAASVARDASVSTRTVDGYYQVLEDTLIGVRLEAWRKGVRARLVAHPRFLFFDLGVVNAINHRLSGPPDARERGRLFEQWLILECRRHIDYAGSEARLYFWRNHLGAEVDLLIEKHGKLVAAVECKTSPHVAGADLGGLRAFAAEHPETPRFVVTPSAEPRRLEDALVTNRREFLAEFKTWL